MENQMGSFISAIHYCVPSSILTDDQLVARFGERPIKSISRMSGVHERRVADVDCSTSDLGLFAADKLIKSHSIDISSIDLIVVATATPDFQMPATACVIHGRLGLSDRCGAFDISLGCTAFPYSLSVVHSMISAGLAKRALLIVADTITKVIHPEDRGLVPLHGDGAMACIVEKCSSATGNMTFFLGTDGKSHHHLIIPASGTRTPRSAQTRESTKDESGIVRSLEHMHMNGPAIFSFSLHKVPEVIRNALQENNLNVENVDLFLFHQANKKMVDQIYSVLKIPEAKQFFFMEKIGNCSAASSAILLAEAWRQGVVKPGMTVLIAAFGVGLSWGVSILKCPEGVTAATNAKTDYDPSEIPSYKNQFSLS
jgi:3-oxoacyl-[acyl-carrier-protein] synthase III